MRPDIRKARMGMGWTQRELAAAVGVTDTYISHLENERATGSVDLYERIAEECGVELVIHFTEVWDPKPKRKKKKKKGRRR